MNILDKFHHWRRRRRWNKQYRSGRWKSLKNDIEAKRYRAIIDQIQKFAPQNPSILDIGCGDGVLTERLLGTVRYSYFAGVDFSSESIKQATEKQLPDAEFIHADVIKFVPSRNFDVIIFNESFYYIPETEKARVLQTLLDHLTPEGTLISSIFREGHGCWEYFKDHTQLKEMAFSTVRTEKDETYWKIGAYKNI